MLKTFDEYAKSIRLQYGKSPTTTQPSQSTSTDSTETAFIYRRMKFLPKRKIESPILRYSGNQAIENYIYNTKEILDQYLPQLCIPNQYNLTSAQKKALKVLKAVKDSITIKPADKNLGIVIMDTDDYIKQCCKHLSNAEAYKLVPAFPTQEITDKINNILLKFKTSLFGYNKQLYTHLCPSTRKTRIPQFYGIPKLHKHFTDLPPLRPIVSHTTSLLSPTAQFIDHVLQPLARVYPDYLHNSTSLVLLLQHLTVPADAVLVTIDVQSLYPSIPQAECLKVVYQEMHSHRDLMLFDPNLIIQLLHVNIYNNFFEFAEIILHQTRGTAMGAAFSPTIANIFMSVLLRSFLATQTQKPIAIKRYIDDIFVIWPKEQDLQTFLDALNSHHPNIHFTFNHSSVSTNFLDLTIYKSETTNTLEVKTYQKPQNLYQYLEYTSCHPSSTYKGLIKGECVRYVRTNTQKYNYEALAALLKKRLIQRNYPPEFVMKCISEIQFHHQPKYLQLAQPRRQPLSKPIFKCLPPPQFSQLKAIVLQQFHSIQHLIPSPLFVPLGHRTLRQHLVRAKVIPTDEQFIDIIMQLEGPATSTPNIPARIPACTTAQITAKPCKHPRCVTCKYLICKSHFKSSKTGIQYPIRHSFTCTSANVIYLITCTKCKKQYVGLTTKALNVRINHHRTNIMQRKNIYICNHFNFPDHSIDNLSVQVIDTTQEPNYLALRELEKFWIQTLQTLRPKGLNNAL